MDSAPTTAPPAPTVADIFPMLGLRVEAGPLVLSGIADEDLPALAVLAQQGVHEPEHMPFSFPWTRVPTEELPLRFVLYHWGQRGAFSREKWGLQLVVRHEGTVVGIQGVSTESFLVTRTGETGSWLGLAHHGRGIGTAMRQVMCALLFDHLGFTQITSAAFTDNPSSLAVSRKVGYVPTGERRLAREGAMAHMLDLVLTPQAFRRGEHELRVAGADAVRRLIGLD